MIMWESGCCVTLWRNFDLVQLKGSTLKKAFEQNGHPIASPLRVPAVGEVPVVYDLLENPGSERSNSMSFAPGVKCPVQVPENGRDM